MPGIQAATAPLPHSRYQPAQRSGVTLIELLVVVAVVALLAAIVLPALAASRAQAARLNCGNQVRAVGNMFTLLKTETGRYPLREVAPGGAAIDPKSFVGLTSWTKGLLQRLMRGTIHDPWVID